MLAVLANILHPSKLEMRNWEREEWSNAGYRIALPTADHFCNSWSLCLFFGFVKDASWWKNHFFSGRASQSSARESYFSCKVPFRQLKKIWIQWLHFRLFQTKCSVSKVASWSWGMSSGIVLTSEKWYRFGQFNLDTWNYVAYTAVLRRHLCHLIFAKECTNPEYHDGVLIISSKTSESIFFSNEFRTCWDQGTQKDPVPIGFRPQCQYQWVTMNPLGRGQSYQKPSIWRFGNSWKVQRFNHVPPKCWNILTHARTSKFGWKVATWTQLLSTGWRLLWKSYFTGSRARAMRPRLKSAASSASVRKPNDNAPVALVMAKLWLQDCFCTYLVPINNIGERFSGVNPSRPTLTSSGNKSSTGGSNQWLET